MKPEERRRLTWEDATERFLDVAELKPGERPKGWEEACDKLTWNAFNSISGAQLFAVHAVCCMPAGSWRRSHFRALVMARACIECSSCGWLGQVQ